MDSLNSKFLLNQTVNPHELNLKKIVVNFTPQSEEGVKDAKEIFANKDLMAIPYGVRGGLQDDINIAASLLEVTNHPLDNLYWQVSEPFICQSYPESYKTTAQILEELGNNIPVGRLILRPDCSLAIAFVSNSHSVEVQYQKITTIFFNYVFFLDIDYRYESGILKAVVKPQNRREEEPHDGEKLYHLTGRED